MGNFLLVIVLIIAVAALAGGRKNDSNKKHYIVRSGKCPTCGSPCKWYVDPDTGSKFFRCGWCGDFNG